MFILILGPIFFTPIRIFENGAKRYTYLVVVSNIDYDKENSLYPDTKINLSQDILIPGVILLGMIGILRDDPRHPSISDYYLVTDT